MACRLTNAKTMRANATDARGGRSPLFNGESLLAT